MIIPDLAAAAASLRERGSVLALVSGGMDSTVLSWWLDSSDIDVVPCIVDYGQHTYASERGALDQVLPAGALHRLLEINIATVFAGSGSHLLHAPDLWSEQTSMGALHLEYRNLVILSVAASIAEQHRCGTICPAFIVSNIANEGDTSRLFLRAIAEVIAAGGAVALEMPFLELTKAQVAELGLALGAPIGSTWSCQLSPLVPCGACSNCVDRLDALQVVTSER